MSTSIPARANGDKPWMVRCWVPLTAPGPGRGGPGFLGGWRDVVIWATSKHEAWEQAKRAGVSMAQISLDGVRRMRREDLDPYPGSPVKRIPEMIRGDYERTKGGFA